MAKTLVSVGNGALVVTQNAGSFTLAVDKSVSVGGGEAAGILDVQGQGSVVLSGKQAFDLGMKLLEAHSPAALVPLEVAGQEIADAAIATQ